MLFMLHSVLNNQALVSANVANNQAMLNVLQDCINREIAEEQRNELIRQGLLTKTPTTVWNISDRD